MNRDGRASTAAASLEHRVRVRGTTSGLFGGVLSGTAWWRSADDGLPIAATVVVSPTGLEPPTTSHRFEVPGLGNIVTRDEVTRLELVFPGLYEVDSVLTVDPSRSNGYRGTLVTTRASISVDSEGRATAEWLIKGYVTEPGAAEAMDAHRSRATQVVAQEESPRRRSSHGGGGT